MLSVSKMYPLCDNKSPVDSSATWNLFYFYFSYRSLVPSLVICLEGTYIYIYIYIYIYHLYYPFTLLDYHHTRLVKNNIVRQSRMPSSLEPVTVVWSLCLVLTTFLSNKRNINLRRF